MATFKRIELMKIRLVQRGVLFVSHVVQGVSWESSYYRQVIDGLFMLMQWWKLKLLSTFVPEKRLVENLQVLLWTPVFVFKYNFIRYRIRKNGKPFAETNVQRLTNKLFSTFVWGSTSISLFLSRSLSGTYPWQSLWTIRKHVLRENTTWMMPQISNPLI